MGEGYYGNVEAGYNLLAPSYDADIAASRIGARMREVFRRTLKATFRGGQRVFEIGCGTGIDALWLARLGLEVVATDISSEMLEQARRKVQAEGLADRVECRKLAASDIGELREEFGSGFFDGGYCHAGALNMEPELARVPGQVHDLLRPGGAFVCSVINKTSLFEVLFYPAVLRPRKAFRRMDHVVPIPISRKEPLRRYVVPARFYSPGEMIRLFAEGFGVERVEAIQAFLPPSNLSDEFERTRPVFGALEGLEDRLASHWPVNLMGHHTLLTFRRL